MRGYCKKIFDHFTLLICLSILCATISAQSNSFTYQGKLTDNGVSANGTYQIQFALFDAAVNGNQIGTTITNSSVQASGGVFTVDLDFGAGAFPGSARYLQLSVFSVSSNAYIPLVPRQQIASAPYAVKALVADTAATAGNSDQLGGIAAAEYVQINNPALTDARDPLPGSANYIQNTGTTQPLANFNISGTGIAAVLSATNYFGINGDRVLTADTSLNTIAGIGAGGINAGSNNSFFGKDAGRSNDTGSSNAFFGARVGMANSSGSFNSFFGTDAGPANQTGQRNSFFGHQSGNSNTIGSNNAYFGADSGMMNIGGSDNSFFGTEAGLKNSVGGDSFFGSAAGRENVSGINNAFFGASAGRNNFDGDANVFMGAIAGFNNTTGETNTFVGAFAGGANISGTDNTLLGALANLGSGNLLNATAIGANAVVSQSNSLVLGNNANVGIGVSAPTSKLTVAGLIETTAGGVKFPDGTTQTSAFSSTAAILNQTSQQASANFNISGTGTAGTLTAVNEFDVGAFRVLAVPNSSSLVIGEFAGSALSTATENTFTGTSAGNANTTGHNNSFFGHRSGWTNVDGDDNTFIGDNAGRSNVGGSFNTFLGSTSGINNLNGSDNTYLGTGAGSGNAAGAQNAYVGSGAGELGSSGNQNTYFGYQAGRSLTGTNNVAIGRRSGDDIAAATSATLLGAGAGLGATNLQFATAIGGDAIVSTSNTIVLGRSGGQDTVRIPGLGSAGSTALCRNANNEISTCSSSLRYKTNIKHFTSGLDIVSRLKPITFDWKQDGMHDLGLGAEDVAAVSELLVVRNASGQVEGVKYDRIGVVLLNAVKEQQTEIGELRREIADLKKLIAAKRSRGGRK